MLNAMDFTPPKSREKIYAWIIELSSPETREAALLELSKKREVAIQKEINMTNFTTFQMTPPILVIFRDHVNFQRPFEFLGGA